VADTDYAGVVYDLDGTLVDLAVDWDTVAVDSRAVFTDHGYEGATDLWTMLDRADELGLRAELERVIGDHEQSGARTSTLAPRAGDLPLSVPTGVCSLNCEAACRIALQTHDLADAVDAVVGRDSVTARKPDPEPLLETLDRLGVPPEESLFVGDSQRDAVTAERAGTAFEFVE
jgi:phosphoglycolate phosphatase